jgi:hypothetical protein
VESVHSIGILFYLVLPDLISSLHLPPINLEGIQWLLLDLLGPPILSFFGASPYPLLDTIELKLDNLFILFVLSLANLGLLSANRTL